MIELNPRKQNISFLASKIVLLRNKLKCGYIINKRHIKSNSFVKRIVLNYKMNKIINKFLLAGDKFMPEMHLKQPGFTYSACGPFT